MKILALNCGSSSVKYQLFDWDSKKILSRGLVERIGLPDSLFHEEDSDKPAQKFPCSNHQTAVSFVINFLTGPKGVLKHPQEIAAVGHRVVHGGDKFAHSAIIDEQVLDVIKEMQNLAPLHNPPNIAGIEAAQKVLPQAPQIAVFDTAFHQTIAAAQYTYALPYSWYAQHGIRRYGFHGTSHLYVSKRAAVLLGKKPDETNVITCHIGNGVSLTAIKNGRSFDTSMGFTPLEGAVMGTRSGDIDPAIVTYMMAKGGWGPEKMEQILNKESGLLGITEKFTDRRDIRDAAIHGNERAVLAIEIEAYRLKKYIGAYAAALGRLDAVVFTAGVGENSPLIRERSVSGLEHLGLVLDQTLNKIVGKNHRELVISADPSPVKIFVIPTNEELVLIEDVVALLEKRYKPHYEFTYSFQDPAYQP